MDLVWATGCFMLLAGVVQTFDIVRRKGERFEYASAMFFGEFGLMFVVGKLIPGGPCKSS